MTLSRKQQVDLTATPYYHCVTRCVRRAFLCYAIMSNHSHLVLRVNLSGAAALSDQEVVDRWLALFKGHVLVDR